MATVFHSQTCTVPALEEDLAARTISMLYGWKKTFYGANSAEKSL